MSPLLSDPLIVRALLGALVAGLAAAMARRAGGLTAGGQWAAFATGTLVTAAGWWWAVMLLAYYVASTLLTRLGRETKTARTESVLPTARERSAPQVFANGGLFALAVLLGEILADPRLQLAGLGALAAAAADTWATEIGMLWGRTPRSILTGRVLPVGVSGGVTIIGTAAAVIAAGLFALVAARLIPEGINGVPVTDAVLLAGLGGSLADSLLGATFQSKRWCEQCRTWTERRVHTCQYRTRHARGLRWMTNDTVNFLATVAGAAIAVAASGAAR